MADFGAPVAQNVDVSPSKGLETLSSLMGLQQKKQALSGQAADVQMRQQDASQRAAMSQIDWGKHIGPDGTLDLGSFSQDKSIRNAAGDYYPDVLAKANQVKQGQIGAKQSLFNLNKDQVGALGSSLGALKTDPDVVADNPAGRQKLTNTLTQFGQTYGEGAAKVAQIYGPMVQHAPQGKLPQAIQALQLQTQDAGKQLEMQAPTTGTVDTGPVIQPVSVGSRFGPTPGAMTAAGRPLGKGLAPTDQPGYRRQVAAATTEGGAGAANDESLYNEITQKGTKAAALKALTQDIRNLAGEVQTGQYSKAMADKWSALKQTFGFKPDDDSFETKRQILSKMAAQLRTQSEAGASTDSERAGISAALPDPEHMNPAAVAQAARYVGALADTNTARAQLANSHRQVNGGKSTGIRETDSSFMQNADPRVFEYQNIPAGPERQAYLKQHFKSKEEVKSFLDKQAALKGYGSIK